MEVVNYNLLQRDDQVARAAKAMDFEHPGWFNKINTADLNMASCTRCILGQTLSEQANYNWGLVAFPMATKHNFSPDTFADARMAPLWVKEIRARLPVVPVFDPIDTEWSELQRSTPAHAYVYA